jgi:hypothetical protein
MKMTEINTEQNRTNANILRTIGQHFVQLNIYNDELSLSITEQMTATRLNMSFIILSFFILMMIRGFTPYLHHYLNLNN